MPKFCAEFNPALTSRSVPFSLFLDARGAGRSVAGPAADERVPCRVSASAALRFCLTDLSLAGCHGFADICGPCDPECPPVAPLAQSRPAAAVVIETTIAGRRAIPGCSLCPSLLPSRSPELAAHARFHTSPHWQAAPAFESFRRTPGPPRPDAGPDAPAVYLPLEEVPPAPSGLIGCCAALGCRHSVPSGCARARAHIRTLASSPVPGPPTRSLAGPARRRVGPAQVPADRCYAGRYAPDRLTRAP